MNCLVRKCPYYQKPLRETKEECGLYSIQTQNHSMIAEHHHIYNRYKDIWNHNFILVDLYPSLDPVPYIS